MAARRPPLTAMQLCMATLAKQKKLERLVLELTEKIDQLAAKVDELKPKTC